MDSERDLAGAHIDFNAAHTTLAGSQQSSWPTEPDEKAETLAVSLRRLAASGRGRTKVGQLREWFELLEAAHRDGVTNDELVNELARHGLVLTLRTYEALMSRVRCERRGETTLTVRDATLTPMPKKARSPPQGSTSQYLKPEDIRRIGADDSVLDEYPG